MTEWIITSTVLTAVMILMRYIMRGKMGLRLQYGLWLLVLVRLLLPISFGSSPVSVLAGAELVQRAGTAWVQGTMEQLDHRENMASKWTTYTMESVAEASTGHMPEDGQNSNGLFAHNAIAWAWIAGMVLLGSWFLGSNLRFARQLRRSRRPLTVKDCDLPVYETAAVETPCLFGLLCPSIYVTPEAAAAPSVLAHATAHEATHYRHKDHIWAILRCVALVLHWYNPLVWWAAALSRRDGEMACDEATVARLGEDQRTAYGRTLIELSCRKHARLLVTATTMTGSAQGLRERIQLLAKGPKTTLGIALSVALLAVAAVGCTFTGAEEETPPVESEMVEEQSEAIEDGRTPELKEALEWLQNNQVQMALRIDNGAHSLYPGNATPNGADYAAALAQYHYEPVEADVASSAVIYILPFSETNNGSLLFYDDTDYVELMLDGGTVQLFEATGRDMAVGDLARLWFDEAEFWDALAAGREIHNQGQDALSAVQAYCRTLEQAHQSDNGGGVHHYSFISCVAESQQEIEEDAWVFAVNTVFLPDNEDARKLALELGAVQYTGGDSAIPAGALQMEQWVQITREGDAWYGDLLLLAE